MGGGGWVLWGRGVLHAPPLEEQWRPIIRQFLHFNCLTFYAVSVHDIMPHFVKDFRSNIPRVLQVCASVFVPRSGNFWPRWRRLVAPRDSGYYWQVAGMPCHHRQIRPSLGTGGRTPPVAPRPLAERHQRRASREECEK